ncbi:MAG: proteasome accessory factor PafA2 family protein [Candidatus Sungbacteria bacterium]|nr:proteasome accessory factor PafA2 family protein [bacterium]MDZ4260665.1 proteasome accessory factor PafA2 family protein [Candidatus Sungbacteria bacterium]
MLFPDRTYGIENEYGTVIEQVDDHVSDGFTAILKQFLHPIKDSIMPPIPTTKPRVWHSNGSCTYVDTGDHPEHATAECRLVRDLVAHNKAGEILISRIFAQSLNHGWVIKLFKNNFGYDECLNRGDSFGCHENYMVPVFDSLLWSHAERLIPFLVSRQIIDGAGCWEGDTYLHSQRAYAIYSAYAEGAIGGRGIVCSKKSNDTGSIPRLHLVLGDSNILECALFLKVGMTSLVLSLIEAGREPRIICNDPVLSLQRVARQDPLSRSVGIRAHEDMSPYEIQAAYLSAACHELSTGEFESEETEAELKEIARLWEQALNAIYSRDTKWMLGRFDWATKKYLGETYLKKHGIKGWSDRMAICRDFDLMYHAISDRTLQERMNKQWPERRIVTDRHIAHASAHAPSHTRAQMREAFIRYIIAQGIAPHALVDWAVVGELGNPKHWFTMNDPLEARHVAWESFLSSFADQYKQVVKPPLEPPMDVYW